MTNIQITQALLGFIVVAAVAAASCDADGTTEVVVPQIKLPDFYQGEAAFEFEYGVLDVGGAELDNVTSVSMGPDGRLYAGSQSGRLVAIVLSGQDVLNVETILEPSAAGSVTGIAFSPLDDPDFPAIYIARSRLYLGPDGSPYEGRISRIQQPGYQLEDVITGLPVSPYEHGTNGIAFDADGRLYIAQGSNTNAGLPAERFPREEVPLSGAILVADIFDPAFDGLIVHDPPNEANDSVDLVSGDVRVFASGFRNPYDLTVHSNGRVFAVDNGPNLDSGPASVGCAESGPDPYEPDELNLIREGDYYGHPNRNRGRDDPRQCTYVSSRAISAEAQQPIAKLGLGVVPGGLLEFTADSFDGALRGALVYVEWGDPQRVMLVYLAENGERTSSVTQLAQHGGRPIDATLGPDGTIYIAEWDAERISYLKPIEPEAGS